MRHARRRTRVASIAAVPPNTTVAASTTAATATTPAAHRRPAARPALVAQQQVGALHRVLCRPRRWPKAPRPRVCPTRCTQVEVQLGGPGGAATVATAAAANTTAASTDTATAAAAVNAATTATAVTTAAVAAANAMGTVTAASRVRQPAVALREPAHPHAVMTAGRIARPTVAHFRCKRRPVTAALPTCRVAAIHDGAPSRAVATRALANKGLPLPATGCPHHTGRWAGGKEVRGVRKEQRRRPTRGRAQG